MRDVLGTDRTNKKVLVVGLGVTGRSVCELLLRQGSRVTGTDLRPRSRFCGDLDRLEEKGCLFRLGGHPLEDFLDADRIIVSPGVPLDIEPLKEASRKGIEILGELDWAWGRIDRPVIAVTGTNGKTTTTTLIGEMIRASGKRVFVGGNIGTPLSQWILNGEDADVLVLEVSSFQLDTATHFCPDVAVLMNITEDHLDRYPDFSAYVESKMSIFARQNGRHLAVINGDDPICRERSATVGSRVFLYSRRDNTTCATANGGCIHVNMPGKDPFVIDLTRSPLKGVHNEENIMAATLAVSAFDVPPAVIQAVIDASPGLSHRLEWVGNWRGIDFYDDSKATNVGAVVKALENFDRTVLLLLGGRDKLGSYEPLGEPMKAKGKGAFVFGESAPRLKEELEKWVPTWSFADLEGAFQEAVMRAAPGDVVLLSPACSSFDQYESYAHRGDHFKRLVRQLKER